MVSSRLETEVARAALLAILMSSPFVGATFASNLSPPMSACGAVAKDSDQGRAIGADKLVKPADGFIQVCGEPGPFRQGKYFYLSAPVRVSDEVCAFSRRVIFVQARDNLWSLDNPDPTKIYDDPGVYMADVVEDECPVPEAMNYTAVSNVTPGMFAAIKKYFRELTSSPEAFEKTLVDAGGASNRQAARAAEDLRRTGGSVERVAIVRVKLRSHSGLPSGYSVAPWIAAGAWSIEVDLVSGRLILTGFEMPLP